MILTDEETKDQSLAAVADLCFGFGQHAEAAEQLGRELTELNAALDAAHNPINKGGIVTESCGCIGEQFCDKHSADFLKWILADDDENERIAAMFD